MAATGLAILDNKSVTSSSHAPEPSSGERVGTSQWKTWFEVPPERLTTVGSFQGADVLDATKPWVSTEASAAPAQKVPLDAEAQIFLNVVLDFTIPIYSSALEDFPRLIFGETKNYVAGSITPQAVDPPRSVIGHRVRELEWCSTHRDELRQYAGQWVVLEGEEVIAHGRDPSVVVAEARARGVAAPYVFYVEVLEQNQATLGL